MEDLTGKNGLVKKMIKNMIEHLLEKEMEDHLGYEKHSISGNNRNGKKRIGNSMILFNPSIQG